MSPERFVKGESERTPYNDVAESVAFTEAIGCGAFSHGFITLLSQ